MRTRTTRSSRPLESVFGWVAPLIIFTGSFGTIGCSGGGDSPTAPASPPAPVPPPAQITVSFVQVSLAVREGEGVEIGVKYQVPTLAAPWQLAVSALPESASPDDFAFPTTTIEIPAGEAISGEAFLELTATPDRVFDEGDETLAVRFVPSPGVNAQLGADLRMVIQDGGVSPCRGVNLVASRPARVEGFVQRFVTVRLSEASESLAMEFVGPYRETPDIPYWNRVFPLHVAAWEVEADSDTIRHELDLRLPDGEINGFAVDQHVRLSFHGAECDAAVATCSFAECDLMQ